MGIKMILNLPNEISYKIFEYAYVYEEFGRCAYIYLYGVNTHNPPLRVNLSSYLLFLEIQGNYRKIPKRIIYNYMKSKIKNYVAYNTNYM